MGKRQSFTRAFKLEAVRCGESGRPIAEVARELGVRAISSTSGMSNSKAKAPTRCFRSRAAPRARRGLACLQRENARCWRRNDFKAARYFARICVRYQFIADHTRGTHRRALPGAAGVEEWLLRLDAPPRGSRAGDRQLLGASAPCMRTPARPMALSRPGVRSMPKGALWHNRSLACAACTASRPGGCGAFAASPRARAPRPLRSVGAGLPRGRAGSRLVADISFSPRARGGCIWRAAGSVFPPGRGLGQHEKQNRHSHRALGGPDAASPARGSSITAIRVCCTPRKLPPDPDRARHDPSMSARRLLDNAVAESFSVLK